MVELTNYHRVSDTNGGVMGAGMPFVSGAMVLNVSNVSDLTNLAIMKHVRLDKIPFVTNPSVASNLLGMNSNHVVVMGARLKVLSLTWVAGLLELHELDQQVSAIAKLAVRQRDELYAANSLGLLAREEMLKSV